MRAFCSTSRMVVPPADRMLCDGSLPERRREQCEIFATSGPAALAKLRSEGNDPSHGGEVGDKRGHSNAKRAAERAGWEAGHAGGAAERERLEQEVLPTLAEVPLSRIVEATGISLRYASIIRRGLYIPHPLHYDALERPAT